MRVIRSVLVTGSSGLIGSAAVEYFDALGCTVNGIDNNLRAWFFGPGGDTSTTGARLAEFTRDFTPHRLDIRDRDAIMALVERLPIDLVVHCAAQPSHDWARTNPIADFEVNALGTLNLLEATRQFHPDAVFCHLSTNKVYGDAPNERPLTELPRRWDYARPEDHEGIDENCRIDRTQHSLFGASKTAADVLAQEYARAYGMAVGVFRAGCVTGPAQAGVELHGFLNYFVRVAVRRGRYRIFGYKGKQVRDHIHSRDVVGALHAFAQAPRPGEVYNIGGGRSNSASILECIETVQSLTGECFDHEYVPQARAGDHICYISDVRQFQSHYPEWRLTMDLPAIWEDLLRQN
jgi:CDP-paratose 2-epimerase